MDETRPRRLPEVPLAVTGAAVPVVEDQPADDLGLTDDEAAENPAGGDAGETPEPDPEVE